MANRCVRSGLALCLMLVMLGCQADVASEARDDADKVAALMVGIGIGLVAVVGAIGYFATQRLRSPDESVQPEDPNGLPAPEGQDGEISQETDASDSNTGSSGGENPASERRRIVSEPNPTRGEPLPGTQIQPRDARVGHDRETDPDARALLTLLHEMRAVLDQAERDEEEGSNILAAYCTYADARRGEQACEHTGFQQRARQEGSDAFVFFDRPEDPTRVYAMGPGPTGHQLLVTRFTLASEVKDKGCYAGFLHNPGASAADARWYHHLALNGSEDALNGRENDVHQAFALKYRNGDVGQPYDVTRLSAEEAFNHLQMTHMLDPSHNHGAPHSCLALGRRNPEGASAPPRVAWAGCSFNTRLVRLAQSSGRSVEFEPGQVVPTLKNAWLTCRPR